MIYEYALFVCFFQEVVRAVGNTLYRDHYLWQTKKKLIILKDKIR